MRGWCFDCSSGRPWLYGEAMEREQSGSFDSYAEYATGWWEPLRPLERRELEQRP